MAFNPEKNDIFHQRLQRMANALIAVREEYQRLLLIYINEAAGHADFVATDIATLPEIVDLKEVMDSLELLFTGAGAITQENRESKLTPFALK